MSATAPTSVLPALSPGIRAMALGAFWFSIMGLLVRLAGERLPTIQVIVLRCAITLVLSYAACRQAGIRNVFGDNRRLLLLRGTLGGLGLLFFFHSLVRNPLAEANLLQYTNPIFAIIIAGVWLKEQVGRAELLSLAVCIGGVVLITRPAVIFGVHDGALPALNVVIGVTGAMFSGAAYAVVRRIGHSEHPTVVVFYLPLMGLLLSLPLSIGQWEAPTGTEWLLLLGTGITTQAAQTYMTRGLRLETAARATTTGYLQIVFAATWGALVLGEWPPAWTIAGAALIVGSALWLALGKQRGGVGDE
ncbi:MAG: DMT family transporter [Gemmatimonadaceae bacterium]